MFGLVKNNDFQYGKDTKDVVRTDSKQFIKDVGIVIDQFDAQPFNLNDAGWPRNDISQMARAQSKAEFDAIMQRLSVCDSLPSNIPKGMSDAQVYDTCRPRYSQSPLELEQFIEFSNGSVTKYLEERYSKNNTDSVKSEPPMSGSASSDTAPVTE